MDAVYLSLSKKFINANYIKIEELGTELQSTREKKTDFLRKIEYENLEDSFVLHAEAQSKDDPRMHFRMVEYFGMLVNKYEMPVYQFVFYFGEGISKMKNFFVAGKTTYTFELISIQEFSYKEFISSDKPEELILAILSDFEDKSKEEIAEMIFSRAKIIINETNLMGKFVNQIEVLSKLRKLDGFIQHFISKLMALDLKLEDTLTFKQGEKQGEKKNRDKMILSLYRKGKFKIQDIADAADVSVQYVKDLIEASKNEEKIVVEEKPLRKKKE
jgi:hypothetical protein